MFVISGLAHRLVDSLALLGTFTLADEGSVAELDLLIKSNLLVFNEAVLDEVLLALFLLLGLEVGGVCGVTPLGVAVLALNDVIVFGLFDHDDLVDTTFTGSSNGTDIEGNFSAGSSLTGVTGWWGNTGSCGSMFVLVFMGMIVGVIGSWGSSGASVEGESVGQTLLIATTLSVSWGQSHQAYQDG